MTVITIKPTAVHYGAGNIGRGFIGPLLSKSHHVVFADVQEQIIDAINADHAYDIHIVGADHTEKQTVSDVSAVHTADSPDLTQALLIASIITTSVGPDILPRIAPSIAQGIKARAKAQKGMFNVIACENLLGATGRLRQEVEKALKDDKDALEYMQQNAGFANCTVDRIAPPFNGETILDVAVEDYYEWVVDEKALRKPFTQVEGMKLSDDLDGYIERKLFTLNTGHAIAAYAGLLKGRNRVDECMQDPQVRSLVEAAMKESGAALVRRHSFDSDEHEQYVHKILDRFANPELQDDLLRVGRAPLRKLRKDDRLVGPVNMARDFNLPREHLLIGVAAALLFDNPNDDESVQLQKMIKEKGIAAAVQEITGLEEGSDDFLMILKVYKNLQEMDKFPRLSN